jgi:peptidoglycan/xylan/chitin deacetylase (PgdA/CDA1 family)
MPDDHGSAANVGRRRMLVVAAGGILVGLGTVVGRGSGHGASAADGRAALPAPRPSTPAASPSASPSASREASHAATRAAASAGPPSPSRPSASRPSAGAPTASRPPAKTTVADHSAPRQPVYYLQDGPKTIALTIDDGPSPVYTPQVLRLLEKYGIRAAFSMVGENVSYYPGIARDVADAGHTIVNHTWDHANLTTLRAARQRTEITRASDAIHAATGHLPRMFRAPYGAWSPQVLACCASEQLTPLDWSVDPRDWARPGVSKIVSTIMRTTRTGSIILEHDGGGNRAQTVAALKVVLPRLLDEGYHFAAP